MPNHLKLIPLFPALAFCLLMIPGCGPSSNLVKLDSAVVVDNAANRCPEPAARDVKEFQRFVAVPKPDVKTSSGDAYSVAALQRWIDAHEAGQWRKIQSGRRLIGEIGTCRGRAPTHPARAA